MFCELLSNEMKTLVRLVFVYVNLYICSSCTAVAETLPQFMQYLTGKCNLSSNQVQSLLAAVSSEGAHSHRTTVVLRVIIAVASIHNTLDTSAISCRLYYFHTYGCICTRVPDITKSSLHKIQINGTNKYTQIQMIISTT